VPPALIAVAVWQSWGGLLVWQDIFIFFATLIPFGIGVTIGFHASSPTAPSRPSRRCDCSGRCSGRWREEEKYAPHLIADPVVRFVDRTFILWAVAGLALPFGLGVALTGNISGGLMGLLWGGAVRIFFLHHITFCISSLCHFFGHPRLRHRVGGWSP
jgi:fatty-acid desaturase